VTVAERDELLDAVERVEHELEADANAGMVGPPHDPLLAALADLVARAVRVWLAGAQASA
jgi:hypothetical protein